MTTTTSVSSSSLAGRQIVVTQAAEQAPELAALLAQAGATPLLYPCLAIAPPADISPLDRALQLAARSGYDWLVLTSANAVRIVAARLAALEIAPQQLASVRVATVGAATAAAVRAQLGLDVILTPAAEVAEGLAAALAATVQPGDRILLPQAARARDLLVQRLNAAGAAVTHVVAYETVRGSGGVDLSGLLAQRAVDAITLASSSAFTFLLDRLTQEGGDLAALHSVCLACIGPITARTVRDAGYTPAVVSKQQSLEGLVAALAEHFQASSGQPSRKPQSSGRA
ncbi:MAG TPA: uroporphyrinogen-III synthase [Chloroflexi bacterium]|nr:uroporphyrinogen-III synthase [Chloroflexota bacterium]